MGRRVFQTTKPTSAVSKVASLIIHCAESVLECLLDARRGAGCWRVGAESGGHPGDTGCHRSQQAVPEEGGRGQTVRATWPLPSDSLRLEEALQDA